MQLLISIEKPQRISGAWLIVALLFVIGALNYLDRTMITTMRESIIEAVPMSDAEFGLLTSVFLWVYGLLSPFMGFLADKFNRSRVIIGSLFIWSVVTWLTSYVTTFEQLLATRVLMGISEACYIPAALALIMDYHRGATRSLATGIHMAGIMTGSSLGFLGGWIAESHHWGFVFHIFGIAGIIYSVILVFVLKDIPKGSAEITLSEKTESEVNFLKGMKDLFRSRSFIFILAYWGLLGVVGWMVIGWLPTFYQSHFKLSQGNAGLYATGYLYPASLVGVILGGFLADRWSRTNPRARILIPVIGLCIAAPCIFMASNTIIISVAIISFIIYALTKAFSDSNLMPVLCMVVNSRYRATGYGILNMFSCIIGGMGLYAGGVLRDSNIDLSITYKFAALILVICAVLLYQVKPKQ